MISRHKLLLAVTMISSAILSTAATAETSSATLGISVNVESSCTLAGNDLDFGTYSPGQAGPLFGQVVLQFSECSATQVQVDASAGGSGDDNSRLMSDEANNVLRYQVYRNSERTYPFGSADKGFNRANNQRDFQLTVYGTVFADQFVPAGDYSDTLNVTLTF